jgi:hypothetical protein
VKWKHGLQSLDASSGSFCLASDARDPRKQDTHPHFFFFILRARNKEDGTSVIDIVIGALRRSPLVVCFAKKQKAIESGYCQA